MLLYYLFLYGMVVICLAVAFKSVKHFIKAMRGQKLSAIILSALIGILSAYVVRVVLFLIFYLFIGYLIVGPWYPFYHNYPLTYMILAIYISAAAQFGLAVLAAKYLGKLLQKWCISLLVICVAVFCTAVSTTIPLVEYRVGLIVDFFIN